MKRKLRNCLSLALVLSLSLTNVLLAFADEEIVNSNSTIMDKENSNEKEHEDSTKKGQPLATDNESSSEEVESSERDATNEDSNRESTDGDSKFQEKLDRTSDLSELPSEDTTTKAKTNVITTDADTDTEIATGVFTGENASVAWKMSNDSTDRVVCTLTPSETAPEKGGTIPKD